MQRLIRDRWMFVPVLILAGSFAMAGFTVSLALRDHGSAVEPDYYRKAVEWDARKAQQAANDSLRWLVTPQLAGLGDGTVALDIAITDRRAAPIGGAAVAVEAIPVKAADVVRRFTLVEQTPGHYRGSFPAGIGGQWEFRVQADRGTDRFTDRFRRLLTLDGRDALP